MSSITFAKTDHSKPATAPAISFATSQLAGDHTPAIAKKVKAARAALQKAKAAFDDAANAIKTARIEEAHAAWLAVLPEGAQLKAAHDAAKRKFAAVDRNQNFSMGGPDHADALTAEGLVTQTRTRLDVHERLVADLALHYKTLAGQDPDASAGPVLPKAKPAAAGHRVVSSQRVQLIRDGVEQTFGTPLRPGIDVVLLVPGVQTDVPNWVLSNRHFLSLEASGQASAI